MYTLTYKGSISQIQHKVLTLKEAQNKINEMGYNPLHVIIQSSNSTHEFRGDAVMNDKDIEEALIEYAKRKGILA